MAQFKNLNILPTSVDLVLISMLLVNEQYNIKMIFILRLYGFEKNPLRLPYNGQITQKLTYWIKCFTINKPPFPRADDVHIRRILEAKLRHWKSVTSTVKTDTSSGNAAYRVITYAT
jgi:hypothetical protein